MRWLAVLLPAVVAATLSTATAAPATPSLAVVARQPLVVRGLHFRAHEWVRLSALADGVVLKRVRATRAGNFVATLPSIEFGRCAGFGIRASGSLGSRASFGLKLPLPACSSGYLARASP